MRQRFFTIPLLAAVLLGVGSAGMAWADSPRLSTQAKQPKKLQILSAREIQRTFGLAARQRGAQAIEISCSPGSSEHCSGDFVTACDNAGGGMSSDPGGGVTCSLPQYD